jgi:hypothetical protein
MDTRQNLHQRALAGAVGPEQGMDLAPANVKIGRLQSDNRAIRFGNVGGNK